MTDPRRITEPGSGAGLTARDLVASARGDAGIKEAPRVKASPSAAREKAVTA